MKQAKAGRVVGFDVARALALFGMVVVNFKIAQGADTGSQLLKWFAGIFEGRASALFVVLAGVGVSFLSRASLSSGDARKIARIRWSLLKRGFLLVILGLAFAPIWPADILHFYGFYFFLGAGVFTWRDENLLRLCLVIAFSFPLLMSFFDYAEGWDWDTLQYHGFWTLDGMLRHIFFNGFHPVIPWSAYLIFGIYLGRQNLSAGAQRQKLFFTALGLWLCSEAVFNWFRSVFFSSGVWGLSDGAIDFLFSTEIIPPMPQYLVAAGAMAVMVVVGSLYCSERLVGHWLLRCLRQTGQLSLTIYVLHVLLGMGLMEATGTLSGQSIEFSLLCSLAYCIFAVVFSVLWLRIFQQGPLEWAFKRLLSL